MLQDLGWLKQVKLKNIAGTVIDPASDAKLEELKTLLQAIENNTDELEITAENVNLNTDELEGKVQDVVDTIGQESGATVLTNLKDIVDKLTELFNNGAAKVNLWDEDTPVRVSHENELFVRTPPKRLLDLHFNGSSLNTSQWTNNHIGAGNVTVSDSFVRLNLTTANGDSEEVYSIQSFTHIFSQLTSFKCGVVLEEENLANNTRIWGMRNPTTNDGWYFCLENGTLYACTEHGGVVTKTDIDAYKPTDGYVHRYDAEYRNYKVFFIIDGVHVQESQATTDHLFDNENLKIYFRNYNTGVTSSAVSLLIEGIALFDDTSSSIELTGLDSNGLLKPVAVTAGGRLKISQEPPDAPAESTPVIITEFNNVSTTHDIPYDIPDGETLIIQRFSGGAEVDSTAGNVVELWYDPLGTGLGMTIIDVIFCSGDGDQHDLREEYLGDGTKRIIMRRRRFGGGAKEIFGRWEGYY